MKKFIYYTAYCIYKKLEKYLFKQRYVVEKDLSSLDFDFWEDFV